MSAVRREITSLAALSGGSGKATIAAWDELASSVEGAAYFQSPDWILAWWQVLAGEPESRVLLLWEDESLVAVVAMVRERVRPMARVPFGVKSWVNAGTGEGAADHAWWVAREDVQPLVRVWIAGQGEEAPVLLRNVPASAVSGLEPRVIDSFLCPRLDLTVPAGGSSSLMKKLRNAKRRLERDEGVRLRWIRPGVVAEEILSDLFRLHEMRRAVVGSGGAFDDERRRDFHRELAKRAREGAGVGAMIAERDADRVGVLYGFRFGDTFAYYQSGWDPALAYLSLGSVLVSEAIEQSRKDGLKFFDFLRGPEPYKYRFGAVDIEESTYLVGGGLAGAVLRGGFALREAILRGRRSSSPRVLGPD